MDNGGANGAPSENLNCYAGSASGIIYYLNENGSCMEVLQADGAGKYLLHYAQSDLIIVITESMVIGQFQMDDDGSIAEVSRIKVSTILYAYCIVLTTQQALQKQLFFPFKNVNKQFLFFF